MTSLKVLGSGSSGNCYVLSYDDRKIILDAGVSIKSLKIGIDFRIDAIDRVLVTHCHIDHSRAVKDIKNSGIRVWEPYLNTKKEIQKKIFGNFTVTCFKVPHDGIENRGFIIEFDGKKLLYATDFEYIPYNFQRSEVDYILIECNYINELLDRELSNKNHVFLGHAELKTTIGAINANKTNNLKGVFICHLSKVNADKDIILTEVKKNVSCPVYICEKGLEVNL